MQLLRQGFLNYFKDFWSYIDLLPSLFVVSIIILDVSRYNFVINKLNVLTSSEEDVEFMTKNEDVVLKSVGSFMLWIKLLYFLRIFEGTGYLIHMVIEVIIDMRYFTLITFIVVVAFANSLILIS